MPIAAAPIRAEPSPAYADPEQVRRAVEAIPQSVHIMTSAFEGRRCGVLARWVQRCAMEPLLVSVALRKGHPIEPIIRDSRGFALCRVPADDPLLERRFAGDGGADPHVFDSLDVRTLRSGSPCLSRASVVIDCEVHRHFDTESDFELYVGLVLEARVQREGV